MIIPFFNQFEDLKKAINSIKSQTYKKIEIIIVDDCSNKKAQKEVRTFIDPSIKFYKTVVNSGVAEARKLGVLKSKGDFITFLDQDDVFKPKCVENKINVFAKNRNINFVISDYIENNKVLKKKKYHKMKYLKKNFAKNILIRPGPFFQSCMFKRDLLENIDNLIDNDAIPSEDWDFFIMLSCLRLNIGYVESADFIWNVSETSQSLNYKKEADGLKYIIEKHNNKFLKNIGKKGLSNHYRMIARVYEKAKLIEEAKIIYRLAFKTKRLNLKNIYYLIISSFPKPIFKFIANYLRTIRGLSLE